MELPLFPDERPVLPPAIPRWLRLSATLDASGRVAHVEIEALDATAALLASRGYWPLPDGETDPEPLRSLLRFGWELCNHS